MVKEREFDYIIVGQGLAGSALSYQLIKAGKKVLVIDEGRPSTSSKVAAGLFNPVTGRKMVKTWMADLLFPYLRAFYREMELVCSAKFLQEIPIYRPFISLEEQNEWMGKSASEEFAPFVKKIHCSSVYPFSNDKYGGIELQQSGYLDIPVYLRAYADYLERKAQILKTVLDPGKVIVGNGEVIYEQYRAARLIFCDGLGSLHQRFFSWLPFSPVKGEILQIKATMKLNNILNRGVFVLPVKDDLFRVGSNYDHRDHTPEITAKARIEIEQRLGELIDQPYEVVKQEAGIRPATRDRRPFIGLHPDDETIGIFNGLGTKGVSLAPYFSGHYANFLEKGKELQSEVNISRYFSLYYDSLKN